MARIEKSIEVQVPLRTAYNQWTQFEEFPKFMESVHEVKQVDDTHLHWRAELGGKQLEWDAEIVDQVPDKRIAWRSTSGAKNSGEVSFQPMGEDKTRISFVLDVAGPSGKNAGSDELSSRTEADLARFRDFIEKRGQESGAWRGEVHQGQPQAQAKSPLAAVQSAAQTSQHSMKEIARSLTDAGQAMQQTGTEATMRIADQARRAQEEWQSSASAASSAALQPFNAMLSLGSGSWFTNFFNAFEEPLNMMKRFTEEMDREFESAMRKTIRTTGGEAAASALAWAPNVDIERHDGKIVVHADLPGIKKEDVQIELHDGQLSISGERRQQLSATNGDVHRAECSYGRFKRTIALPEEVDADNAQATIHDGVLEVTLPASRRTRSKRIEIQSEDSDFAQGAQRPPQAQAQAPQARAH